jgi:polysaccharide chain length determinant protein (PEP-CTERM system associated)
MKADDKTAFVLEVADVLLRRWWTIVAGVVVGLAASLVAMDKLPKIYEATTKIFVARQRIPEDYVRTTVVDDMQLRMAALKEAVLSRPYVERIIEEHYPPKREGEELEREIETIRSKVTVSVRKDLFTISYRDSDPARAATVVNALAQLYIDENAQFRATRAGETTNTLEQLAADVWKELTVKEQAITEYTAQHPSELESNRETNLRMLEMKKRDLETSEHNLAAEKTNLLDLKSQLARAELGTIIESPRAGGAIVDPDVAKLAQLQKELQDLRARYTDDHPNVKGKSRELEAFRLLLQPAQPAPSGTPGDLSAPGSRLGDRIATSERRIHDIEAEQARIQQEIAVYQRRIEATPMVEARLAELKQGYDVLKDRYNDYQAKAEQAKGAQKIEEGRKGEQFEIIEGAVASSIPVEPKPLMVFGANLAWALLLFIAPSLLPRFLRPVISSQKSLRALADVPVLVVIPPLPTAAVLRGRRRIRAANIAFTTLSVALVVAAFWFANL